MSITFLIRYYISKWLLTAALFVMPGTRYKTELLIAMYDLKDRVIKEVEKW
jgi:hypothetical protein